MRALWMRFKPSAVILHPHGIEHIGRKDAHAAAPFDIIDPLVSAGDEPLTCGEHRVELLIGCSRQRAA
jgi:hypothetical protein